MQSRGDWRFAGNRWRIEWLEEWPNRFADERPAGGSPGPDEGRAEKDNGAGPRRSCPGRGGDEMQRSSAPAPPDDSQPGQPSGEEQQSGGFGYGCFHFVGVGQES